VGMSSCPAGALTLSEVERLPLPVLGEDRTRGLPSRRATSGTAQATALLYFGRCRGAEALEPGSSIGSGWLVVLFDFSAFARHVWYVSNVILSCRRSLHVAR
jgi:hypothetical protein